MVRRRRSSQLPLAVEHEVAVEGLDPRHDGVRIAHLSDLHVGRVTGREQVEAAVRIANEAEPDVIVMTGDYVTYSRREIELVREQLGGLRARRVLVVLGNHDYYVGCKQVAGALSEHGYEVLRNQHTEVDVGGAPLQVVGVDDPVTRRHDLDQSFRGVPRRRTRIVLCHGPELANKISDRGADLVLSGHTHGGQIFIRGITDKIVERLGLRYLSGFYDVGDAKLYVTPGIGSSSVRTRVGEGTRAEVAVHTLRAA